MRPPTRPAAVLFLVLFAAQSGLVVLTPLVPDVAGSFGTSSAAVGGLRLGSALTGGVVAIALASPLRAVGARRLLVAGLALVAWGSFASALAPTFTMLGCAQAAVGGGIAICVTGAMAAAGDWAVPAQRSRVLAWALAGPPTAWIVGMPVVGLLGELGWRVAWAAVPSVASAAALLALGVVRPDQAAAVRDGTTAPLGFDRSIAGYALAETLAYGGWGGTLIYAAALLRESYGASLSAVGLLLGCAAVAYLPGTFLAGRRAAAPGTRFLALSTIAAAALVTMFGALRPGLMGSMVLFATLTFVVAARLFAGGALAVHAAPQQRRVMAGARGAASQLGYVLGAAAGMAALPLGGYPALGLTFGGLFVLAAAVPLCVQPWRPVG